MFGKTDSEPFTLWNPRSSLLHVTVSPTLIVKVLGENVFPTVIIVSLAAFKFSIKKAEKIERYIFFIVFYLGCESTKINPLVVEFLYIYSMNDLLIECCANSIESAINGENGGAHRIELCRKLEVGGITPFHQDIIQAKETLTIALNILIRPRASDFVYTENELKQMIHDIIFCKEVGCDGVVIGALNPDGSINKKQCEQMIDAANGMHITFHRAFDEANNLEQNLEDIIECGCDSLLTAGQSRNVEEGFPKLETLVKLANNRINILAGSGVNVANVESLYQIGISSFHLSGNELTTSGRMETSTKIIRAVVEKLNALA